MKQFSKVKNLIDKTAYICTWKTTKYQNGLQLISPREGEVYKDMKRWHNS